jgi:hypothetical protein
VILYNGGNLDDSCELLHAKLATLRGAPPIEQESSGGKLRGYPPRNPDSRPPDYKGLLEFDRARLLWRLARQIAQLVYRLLQFFRPW